MAGAYWSSDELEGRERMPGPLESIPFQALLHMENILVNKVRHLARAQYPSKGIFSVNIFAKEEDTKLVIVADNMSEALEMWSDTHPIDDPNTRVVCVNFGDRLKVYYRDRDYEKFKETIKAVIDIHQRWLKLFGHPKNNYVFYEEEIMY